MEKYIQKVEKDESSRLATEIAEAINGYVGTHEWSGDTPFTLQMADQKNKIAYLYNIRRGVDWITIQEQVSDNPRLVRSFQLSKKDNQWTYLDPYLIKYKESSLDKLLSTYERLKIAIEASAPKSLDDNKLLPSETE